MLPSLPVRDDIGADMGWLLESGSLTDVRSVSDNADKKSSCFRMVSHGFAWFRRVACDSLPSVI